MSSRRKFIEQSTLATIALVALNPFNSLASSGGSSITNIQGRVLSERSIHFLYPGRFSQPHSLLVQKHIEAVNAQTKNLVLLYAGHDAEYMQALSFDATVFDPNNNGCRVIERNGIRIGIITVTPDISMPVSWVQKTARDLKNGGNCQLVVCLSHLGYKTKNAMDDRRLAATSSHIDVIVGGHATNYTTYPVTCLNKLQHEVILQSGHAEGKAAAGVTIVLDQHGQKRSVQFSQVSC